MADGRAASDLIVYIDRSAVRVGRLEALKAGISALAAFVEAREPQLIAYGFHLDEEAGELTVVAVHPDSASLQFHMEVGGAEFRKLADLLTLRSIEVYGSPSDDALALLHRKAEALGGGGNVVVRERYAGFARTPVAG